MKGVILAGGRGTRLGDVTRVVNKHLLPVYSQPMIYYPIATLRAMGCDDILIITGGSQIGGFAELLGSGYTYRVQATPGGIADALLCAKGYVDGVFPVILGDNYFSIPPLMPNSPAIFTTKHVHPEEFGVYADGRIVEKPTTPASKDIVTGLYVYDDRVFKVIPTLKRSERGELEITDVNNWYLEHGQMHVIELAGRWSDMGTPDSLLTVAQEIRMSTWVQTGTMPMDWDLDS